MKFISSVIGKVVKIGEARYCKNTFLNLCTGAVHNEHHNIAMETGEIVCDYYPNNAQCLRNKCHYRLH